jgi:hypothetical protein
MIVWALECNHTVVVSRLETPVTEPSLLYHDCVIEIAVGSCIDVEDTVPGVELKADVVSVEVCNSLKQRHTSPLQ